MLTERLNQGNMDLTKKVKESISLGKECYEEKFKSLLYPLYRFKSTASGKLGGKRGDFPRYNNPIHKNQVFSS